VEINDEALAKYPARMDPAIEPYARYYPEYDA